MFFKYMVHTPLQNSALVELNSGLIDKKRKFIDKVRNSKLI